MALDIVKLYLSQISEFFKLSDVAIMSSDTRSPVQPPYFPQNSHSICTAHYLQKILTDLQETVNDLNSLDIGQDIGLTSLLESVRWKFVDFLVHSWLRGLCLWHLINFKCNQKWSLRCRDVLWPGNLGVEARRAFHDSLSYPNRVISAAHDDCCFQASGGC